MSGLILCHSALAKNPYFFVAFGMHIYSIEELCFLLTENAYLLDEDVLDPNLCTFLSEEAGMPKLGGKLSGMLKEGCSVGEFVLTILSDSFYLTEEELQKIKQILLDSSGLDRNRKHKLRGDNMLKNGKYALAIDEYRFILGTMDRELYRETYAEVLHNMGCAYARLFLLKEAAECFYDSYNISGEQKSVLQFLLASRFLNDEEKYNRLVLRYGFNDEIKGEAERLYKEYRTPDEESKQSRILSELKELKESGKIGAYYEKLEDTLGGWKKDYRVSMLLDR
ncbi:MAG: hypothetical protein IJ073_05280 [Lachnospiraceae bacterium]|nr:hypothetical protein [Lachnospiraceae bacterium]